MQETAQGIYDTACRANQRIRLQKRPVIADWKPASVIGVSVIGVTH